MGAPWPSLLLSPPSEGVSSLSAEPQFFSCHDSAPRISHSSHASQRALDRLIRNFLRILLFVLGLLRSGLLFIPVAAPCQNLIDDLKLRLASDYGALELWISLLTSRHLLLGTCFLSRSLLSALIYSLLRRSWLDLLRFHSQRFVKVLISCRVCINPNFMRKIYSSF